VSVLNFFGWQLELTLRDDGFDVKPPSPGNQGDQYWTTGRLRAVRRGGRLELVTFGQDGRLGQIQLRLAGLDIALTVAGLRLAAAGTDYRPAAEAGNSVLMAMGMAAATRNLVRIGPVALRGPYALTFDRQDPRAVGTFDIRSDWASGRTDDLPLSIALALGSGVRVDLYRREVVVPAGAALARLRAGTDIISKIAAFDNPTPLTIGFASIAANKALPLHLKRRSDSRPVPLNLRPKPLGPHAPIEALSGDLNLLLR
jgi:hypothetical protein